MQAARQTKIRALNAVAQYKKGDFDAALTSFIQLDINPAKVVALYPEVISGRLHVPRERWIPLFGGPEPKAKDNAEKAEQKDLPAGSPPSDRTPSPAGSVRSARVWRRGTLETKASGPSGSVDKDGDRVSLRGRTKEKSKAIGEFFCDCHQCLLVRY